MNIYIYVSTFTNSKSKFVICNSWQKRNAKDCVEILITRIF